MKNKALPRFALGTILAVIDIALSSLLFYGMYSGPMEADAYVILLLLIQGPGLILGIPLLWTVDWLWPAPPPVAEPRGYLLVALCGVLAWFAVGRALDRLLRPRLATSSRKS